MPYKNWTKEEDAYLKENYRKLSDSEIAEELDRTKNSVTNRRHQIGLKKRKGWREDRWSEEDEDFLRENPDMPIKKLAEELSRSEQAIKDKRGELGIKTRNHWTEEETKLLKRLYGIWTAAEIADYLGRNKESVYNKAKREDVSAIERKEWSESEIEFIRKNHEDMTEEELADQLDRTQRSVASKKFALGIATSGRHWTEEDEQYLKENFPQKTDRELAENLDRTIRGVKNRRRRELGLVRKGFLEDTIWQAWEQVCIAVGRALYEDVEVKPELPNGTFPEMRVGDTLIEVKKSVFTHRVDADVEHYRPHCDRLEFWSLFGVREFDADAVETVGVERLQDRVREADLEEEKRAELVRKLELCANGVDPYRSGQASLDDPGSGSGSAAAGS